MDSFYKSQALEILDYLVLLLALELYELVVGRFSAVSGVKPEIDGSEGLAEIGFFGQAVLFILSHEIDGIDHHQLMISQEQFHILPAHHILYDLDAVAASVDNVADNIQKIILGEFKLLEELFVCAEMTVKITYCISGHVSKKSSLRNTFNGITADTDNGSDAAALIEHPVLGTVTSDELTVRILTCDVGLIAGEFAS